MKHDGYRLQIHVRDGRVRLYTMNGNDWTKRYPRIMEEAARLRAPLIIDAEVVHLSKDGIADFDALHNRLADEKAVALAFDLLLSVACDKKCAGNTKTYRDKINQQSNRCRRWLV